MAITAFSQWSATPASNVDLNSIPLSDSMFANQIDGTFQEMMAQLKTGVDPAGTEGFTTPTVTASSGTFTNVGCVLMYRKTVGLVSWVAHITSSNAGTAAGYIAIPLPFTAIANSASTLERYPVNGNEVVNHLSLSGHVTAGTASARLYKYDGTTPIFSGMIITCGGQFFV